MTNEVKFKQGLQANLTQTLVSANIDTVFAATDKPVLGIGGQLFYGQPTIEYTNDKIVMYGISGDTSVKLGEVDLTLESFLEGATYIPGTASTEGYSAETAAYNWAHGIASAITQEQVTSAYTSAFGASYTGDKSAVVMVMHAEHASGDTHSVVVLPVGKLIGDAQTEIDNIETAVGLSTTGTHVDQGGYYTSGKTTVEEEIGAIDIQVKNSADEIDTIETGAGLNADGTYTANSADTYISGATSLKNADDLLDAAVKANADAIAKNAITSTTFNSVNGVITTGAAGTSIAYTVDGDDIEVGDYTTVTYADPFSAKTGVESVASGDTIDEAINKVESAVKVLVDEVLADEATDAAAIKALGQAAGTIATDGTIGYTANTADTYISGATSLADADDKLDAAIKAISNAYKLSSTKKTIDITTATTGTNIDVNLDEKTINANTNGELGVVVASKSATSAVNLTTGDSGVDVVLTLEPTDSAITLSQADGKLKATLALDSANASASTSTGVILTQSTDGLKAALKLNNDAAAAEAEGAKKESGIGLALDNEGDVKATLYWGTF